MWTTVWYSQCVRDVTVLCVGRERERTGGRVGVHTVGRLALSTVH